MLNENARISDLIDGLIRDGSVRVRGLGKLYVGDTPEHQRRHPATGEEMIVPAGKTVRLRPSKALRRRLQRGNAS